MASYEQALNAQTPTRTKIAQLTTVRCVKVVRNGDGFGLAVEVASLPPLGVDVPSQIDGVPVSLRVTDDVAEAQGQ